MNMGQRYVQLENTYTINLDGTVTLHVSQLPPNAAIIVPGPASEYRKLMFSYAHSSQCIHSALCRRQRRSLNRCGSHAGLRPTRFPEDAFHRCTPRVRICRGAQYSNTTRQRQSRKLRTLLIPPPIRLSSPSSLDSFRVDIWNYCLEPLNSFDDSVTDLLHSSLRLFFLTPSHDDLVFVCILYDNSLIFIVAYMYTDTLHGLPLSHTSLHLLHLGLSSPHIYQNSFLAPLIPPYIGSWHILPGLFG